MTPATAVAEAPAPATVERNPDTDVLLVDLSSIAHPIWHMSQNEPDVNTTSHRIIERVRALASGRPRVAICCDSGKSFRRELDPNYKGNRPESDARLHHQIKLAVERLKADGFPIWTAPGFEADDVIASAAHKATALGLTVTIATDDKDLCQLVTPAVVVKRLRDGSELDVEGVKTKYGVFPDQMRDYLTLLGDKSDNVPGCPGVGETHASKLLGWFGSLDKMYEAFDRGATPQLTPRMRTLLQDFRAKSFQTSRELIALRSDVDVPLEELSADRHAHAAPLEAIGEDLVDTDTGEVLDAPVDTAAALLGEPFEDSPTRRGSTKREPIPSPVAPGKVETTPAPREPLDLTKSEQAKTDAPKTARETAAPVVQGTVVDAPRQQPQTGQAVARREPSAPLPVHPEFTMQLEPRHINEAVAIANQMFASQLFSQYGTPQAVLATIMAGRELGFQAMASLRSFHVIEGRPTLSAGAIQALILKSGKAKFFRCIERTPQQATFETQRGDDPPVKLAYTIAEGRQAFSGDDSKWNKSGWGRNPADMCVARAATKLARLVYPDVVLGIYAPEEFD